MFDVFPLSQVSHIVFRAISGIFGSATVSGLMNVTKIKLRLRSVSSPRSLSRTSSMWL